MATPGVYSNPEKEAAGLNKEEKEAFEQGHDADLSINNPRASVDLDIEKEAEGKISRKSTITEPEPNEIWWDGPEDPANPLNWSSSRKWSIVFVLSLITLITYVFTEITLSVGLPLIALGLSLLLCLLPEFQQF